MFEIKDLNELQKKLQTLQNNVRQFDGQHHIPVTELLTPAFVSKHTKFSTADELFEASGYQIENERDFAAIPDEAWDEYIRSISSFSSWKAMLSKGADDWVAKQLGI